jgi:hypothetical protein
MASPASNTPATTTSAITAPTVATTATNATNATNTTNAKTATTATSAAQEPLPSQNTLLQAAKLAIDQDRAIMLDYYRQTANGTAFLGEDPQTQERILVKSKEEFTSLIKKLYKVNDEFIVLTENSLYVVSGKIQKRKVNLASLHEAYEADA